MKNNEKEYKLYEENENNRKNKIKAHNLQVEEIIKTKKETLQKSRCNTCK